MGGRTNLNEMKDAEREIKRYIAEEGPVYFLARPEYPLKNDPTYKYLGDAPIYVNYFYMTKTRVRDYVVLNLMYD
jgi:hypothetical protein